MVKWQPNFWWDISSLKEDSATHLLGRLEAGTQSEHWLPLHVLQPLRLEQI